MGNPDGRTWLTKTKEQKQQDIQKHFFKSPFPEIERRIKQLQIEIKKIKAKRRRRKDRKKIKKIKKWLEYQESLLTEEEMINIIYGKN